MKSRLRNEEKESIHRKYELDILYKLLFNPGTKFASKLAYRISPEELFIECFDILDSIKEKNRDDANYYVSSLWDREFCNLRDIKKDEESEEDVKKAVAVIIFGAAFCLNLSKKPIYTELAASVFNNLLELEKYDDKIDILENVFTENYYQIDSGKAQQALEEYMESDEYISDEIYELLNPANFDIGDGTIPMIPHRFKFCKPSVSNARAREINKELWDRCQNNEVDRVLLLLKNDLKEDVELPNNMKNLHDELSFCYGLEISYRQFTNKFHELMK